MRVRRVSLLSSELHSERTRVNGHVLQQEKFKVDIRKHFSPDGCETLGHEAREMEKSPTQTVAAQSPEDLIQSCSQLEAWPCLRGVLDLPTFVRLGTLCPSPSETLCDFVIPQGIKGM